MCLFFDVKGGITKEFTFSLELPILIPIINTNNINNV